VTPRHNLLTDIAGLTVGHADDAALASGVTAVLFDQPVVAAVAVLGGAPGGRDLGMLSTDATVERIDAIVLAGGSAFGLDAAGGVQAVLRAAGRGFAIAGQTVPLVAQAILFDLASGGNKSWGERPPYWDLGREAARGERGGAFALGSVGAGMGATTATLKGGLGSASALCRSGHTVAALVAVNALGSAVIGDGPHFWAAPFERDNEFGGLGWPDRFTEADLAPRLKTTPHTATTIGIVVTDAMLSKAEAKRLAIMAHDGLARAVLPAHAPLDGDTIFAAATGARALKDAKHDLAELGHTATLVMARAIARGVFEARALAFPHAQPDWRSRFRPRA
jgi:L-aminopeptidase/D-esterase-like protein